MSLPTGVAAIFPFAPDWSKRVEQVLEYQTDILRSRNRTGQWRALRSKPREQLGYTLLLDGDEAAAFDYRLWSIQARPWLLPLWPHRRLLSVAAIQGGQTLQLDGPLYAAVRPGDDLLLLADGQEPEAAVLDSLSGDRRTLTLTAPLATGWPARSALYPAWQALLTGPVRAAKLSDRVLRAMVRFHRLVDPRPPALPPAAAELELDGLEVLLRQPNWAQGMNLDYDWQPELQDGKTGPIAHLTPAGQPPRSRTGTVLCDGRDEVAWWQGFFDRCRGRQQPFLMPTWQGDLLLQPPLSPGADFEVAGTDLGRFMPANPVHPWLMLRRHDGTLGFYRVDTIAPDFGLGVTTITTSDPWDQPYSPWSCSQICFVTACHLASDTLTISWISDEVAELTLAVTTEEAPDEL